LALNLLTFAVVVMPVFQKSDSESFINDKKLIWEYGVVIAIFVTSFNHFMLIKNTAKIKELAEGKLSGKYTKEQRAKYNLTEKLSVVTKFLKVFRIYLCIAQAIELFRIVYYLIFHGKSSALTMSFPFDTTSWHTFVFALLWTELTSVIFISAMIVVNSLLSIMVTNATIELDIWTLDFVELKNLTEVKMVKKLPELVDRHNVIIETIYEIEGIFSSYFLASLVLNSFSICLNLFQLVVVDDFFRNILNLLICFLMFVMIGKICFFGQMLIDSSENLSFEIYNCGWEGFRDFKLKKLILLMLMRSQKPAKLSFMKFGDVKKEKFRDVSLELINKYSKHSHVNF
jgi:7tm Odorant receptor